MPERSELDVVRDVSRTLPVDVPRIFRELGIRYVEADMAEGESGRIEKRGGQYIVTVNSLESPQRRRFTAAHELAHYLLHRDLLQREGHLDRLFGAPSDNPSRPLSPLHEVQANKLAADLLLPGNAVRERHAKGLGLADLAREFGVSSAAMKIRLESLRLSIPEANANAA